MIIEWLVIWGVTEAAGILACTILGDLAKGAAEDYVKDFFKDCLKKVIRLPEKDVLKEAYGKALKEFLELIEEELKDAGYQEAIIKKYIPYLQRFIKREEVSAALGMAFNVECKAIDTALLVRVWKELNSPLLPESMNWDFLSKSYIRAVKKIVQNSDKLRPIFEVQTLDKIAEAVQEVAGIAPVFDLEKYAEGLREQYGNLKLESLDTTGVYYNELKLWKIFIPQNLRECQEFIPQVYELPKDRALLLQESGQLDALELAEAELENHRKRYVEQPIRGVFEVLGDPQELAKEVVAKYAVILGDPGSGKSTLLQYLALIWAERPVRDLPLYPLPLLLELRTYARDKQAGKCKDIVSFIHGGNITCRLNQQDLHEKLKNGDVIALFDGIDEVFDPALRDEVVTDIHRFTNEYPKVRSIATSRWLGYKAQRLRDAGFQHFMLQELNDEQMQEFVVRWHDLNFAEGADKERKRERLQKAIRESRSIKELAGNPLLLTMMAILNRNQELPRDRPELYNQASRVLLHQWDLENKLGLEDPKLKDWKITIDYKDKQAMLRKVAYHMQANEKGLSGNLISSIALENILTDYLRTILEKGEPRMVARLMIEQLRHRNFILCYLGADFYAFVHRTFLEYFCASEFVDSFEKQRTMTEDQLKTEVFGQHWHDEAWHEVLRLICGLVGAPVAIKMIEYLMQQDGELEILDGGKKFLNVFLSSDCLIEIRNSSLVKEIESIIESQLKKLIWYKFSTQNSIHFGVGQKAVEAITYLYKDSPQTLIFLKSALAKDKDYFVISRAVIKSLASHYKDDPDTLPLLKDHALNNQNAFVRMAAVQEIAKGWKDDADTLPLLKDRALNDQDEYVRMAAVQEIAKGWKDESDTLPLLKDRALNDQHEYVRRAAVQEIAKGWKDESDTLPLLKDRALNDQNEYVRRAAVQEIAKGWKDESDTLPLLKDRALNDQDGNVRSAAVQEIAKGWKDESDTLPLLKDRALNDQDGNVRSAAVQEIAKGWKDDSDTLPWLKDRTLKDQNKYVRMAAVQEIAKGWKDDSDTLPWLKDRALNDWTQYVRMATLEVIAKGWKDDPQTFNLLYDRAIHDPFKRIESWETNPRQTALERILEHYSDKPQTLELLKAISSNDSDEKLKEFAKEEFAKLSENPEGA
jgi:predicted NACHT family NTPase